MYSVNMLQNICIKFMYVLYTPMNQNETANDIMTTIIHHFY